MRIGTKSLLFGAHQFAIHPVVVAIAWWRLYGFTWDPRLWVAFVVHDWGYWGKPNIDGPEGERHVELGARIMGALFGDEWGRFVLFHSRHYAARCGQKPSRLCFADKYAFCIEPSWMYLPRAILSGEIREFKWRWEKHTNGGRELTPREWHAALKQYMGAWVDAHKDGQEDRWTKASMMRARMADFRHTPKYTEYSQLPTMTGKERRN